MFNKWIISAVLMMTAAAANAQSPDRIDLQNIRTREVAYCYDNSHSTAEECALYFEKQGLSDEEIMNITKLDCELR